MLKTFSQGSPSEHEWSPIKTVPAHHGWRPGDILPLRVCFWIDSIASLCSYCMEVCQVVHAYFEQEFTDALYNKTPVNNQSHVYI